MCHGGKNALVGSCVVSEANSVVLSEKAGKASITKTNLDSNLE